MYQKPSKKHFLAHLWQNVVDSQHGLGIMLRESGTVHRIYPLMIGLTLILGLAVGFVLLEWVILGLILLVDLIVETMNSAVEEVCDRITTDYDPAIKRAKDLGSAAVYLCHLTYIVVAIFFVVSQMVDFAWWSKIIPA